MPIRFKMKQGFGKHHIRINGKNEVLSPGDEICCEPWQLGGAIKRFDQLDPDPPAPQPKSGLKAMHVGRGMYNVINEATGKKINDKPLPKEEAFALVANPPGQISPDDLNEELPVAGA